MDVGEAPCEVHGAIIRDPAVCSGLPYPAGEIASDSLVDFATFGLTVFLGAILLVLLSALGWRLLKWAVSG